MALVDARDFAGFTTNAGYLTLPSTGVAPSAANRTGPGDTVNFFFANSMMQNTLGSATPGGLGNTSDWLEIDTNAFTLGTLGSGSIGVEDGGVASMLAYSPAAIPEPTTTYLVGGALLLMGLVRFRRSKTSS